MDELIETSFLLPCSRGRAVEIRLNDLGGYSQYLRDNNNNLKDVYIVKARQIHDPSLGCRVLLDMWWKEQHVPIALCPDCREFWNPVTVAHRNGNSLLVGAMESDEWREMLAKAFLGQPYKYFCGPEFHFKRVSEVLHGK